MKILQVITSLSTGGAEKLVADSVPLYQQQGIEMDVLSLKEEKTPFWQLLAKRSNGKIVGLTAGSVYNPFLIFKIIPYLRRYDIIHIHLFPALYWVVFAKLFSRSKVALIFTEHSTFNNRRQHFILKNVDRIIYSALRKVITISQPVHEQLLEHTKMTSISAFELIHNGVDLIQFKEATALSREGLFSDNDIILIQVSGFREEKDQPTVIRALSYLDQKYKLLLIGCGPLQNDCEELVSKLHLQDRVKFLGVRTDVPALLKMSDIVVLSSFYEGLSLSSIEGMAVRPFIASDVEGLRDIVGGYGMLFERGNAAELADKITRLTRDPLLYKEISEKCSARATDFDIHKMIEGYVRVYQDVLS